MQIVPAILTNEVAEARKWLDEIVRVGKFEKVQVDFIDGEFTTNRTIEPREIEMTAYLGLEFEAHLMVTQGNLDKYVEQVKKTGFDEIIVQAESISDPGEFRAIALDIHSPVEMVEPYLDKLKLVLVMGVEPGFGGQEIDKQIFEKIETLRELRKIKGLKFRIGVDGGVQKEHLERLRELEVDEVVIGAERALNIE